MNASHLQFNGSCALLLLASLVLLASCEQDRVSTPPVHTVDVYEVGRAIMQRERTFLGRVVPADLTRVSFRIPGKIDHLAVQAGHRVVEGQLLAHIEDSIQRQVLADASAQYKLSQRQLERAENLHQRGSLSSAQRDRLQASFRLAQANLKLAEAGLSYARVLAPFDGTVADVNKELYEAAVAGETVVTLYRNDRTDVLINIPDILPAKVHQAKNITAVEVKAVFSGSSEVHTMRYLKGSTARNPKTQAFQIWSTMPTTGIPFPPGLPVTMTLDLEAAGFTTETGLLVPLTALEAAAQEDNFLVWRYEDGVAHPQAVEVSRITQRGALISGGLQAGDLIVTTGLSRLRAGQAIDIKLQNPGQ
jgi:RND family efflux transporter MFP subunit